MSPWGVATSDVLAAQAGYHRELFAGLFEWDAVWELALEMGGDPATAARLGLDQLGHFGPPGVELVAERIVESSARPPERVVELGSGFGGVLRQLAGRLRESGWSPQLTGVDFVPEHCALAAEIGRAVGEPAPSFITADVRELPFASASADVVLACGSASHFAAMDDVLAEARRVLRPGGIVVMTDEVALRPDDAPDPGPEFLAHHPPEVFPPASPELRLAQLGNARLDVERFAPLTEWATALLRERVRALRFLGGCAARMFGASAADAVAATLSSAAGEYERGSVIPTLIVARA